MHAAVAITYTVLGLEPNTHRTHFQVDVRGIRSPRTDLLLPVWAPGAYEIRDSAREVRDVSARPSGTTREIPVEHVEKNHWRIPTEGVDSLEVRYTVYGYGISDDGLDLTDAHLFLNATRCLPWVAGREHEPVELALHLPPGWKAFAELPRVGEHPARFRAENYEELVDTPVDCGNPVEITVRPAGIPHHVLVCGGPGNYEVHRIEEDVTKIVEAQVRFFGDSPLKSYTFFLHLADRRDGGLEHRASTALVVDRNSFRPPEEYENFLTLVSHEYFHLYNVKRIRPKVLGPFDFTRENYTRQLWWMEGTTDYASALLVRRAGLFTPARYLSRVAELFQRYLQIPGRLVKSLEEASFSAWIDLYQRYEETRNTSVSYYLKGYLVSLALDLEIRQRTENQKSLDDIFRHLWNEYGKPGRGLEEGELYTVFNRVSGLDLGEFVDRYIRGTAAFEIDPYLRHAGLSFAAAPKPTGPGEPTEPAYLGVELQNEGGRVRVREVLDDAPARRAGLSPSDEIVAVDGSRVLFEGFTDMLKRYSPGDEITLHVFRRGMLTPVRLTAGKAPPSKYVIAPVKEPTELAKRIYASWLMAPWEPASPNPPA